MSLKEAIEERDWAKVISFYNTMTGEKLTLQEEVEPLKTKPKKKLDANDEEPWASLEVEEIVRKDLEDRIALLEEEDEEEEPEDDDDNVEEYKGEICRSQSISLKPRKNKFIEPERFAEDIEIDKKLRDAGMAKKVVSNRPAYKPIKRRCEGCNKMMELDPNLSAVTTCSKCIMKKRG